LTDRSVRSRADALQVAGLPVVGAIPRIRRRVPALPGAAWRLMPSAGEMSQGGRRLLLAQQPVKTTRAWRRAHKGGPLVTLPEAPAAYAESFNQLHANLALGYQDRPLKTVVFTSSVPGEGKTMSAVNFALALASRGVRVLLIDGDLRCGRVNEVFGCPRQPGFAELLSGRAKFDGVARTVSVGDGTVLVIVPAGDLSPTPGRLLSIEAVREVLGTVAPQFDVVLIDSPPVNLLADASLLGSAADAVLLVVRAGHTRSEALRYAMDQLTAARAPVIGTVLNDVDPRRHSGYDGSYRYLSEVERYYHPAGNGSGGNGR
jgi:capsular exopolysaccharide synthesis family protein